MVPSSVPFLLTTVLHQILGVSSSFCTQIGCTTVQFNSDTNCPELEKPTSLGLSPTNLPQLQTPFASPGYHLLCWPVWQKSHKLPTPWFDNLLAAAAAASLQLCLTQWDPIDGSPPGSPVPGILQARTLEWVAISFSNAWKWKVKVKSLSRVQPLATPWTAAYQGPPSMGFSRQEYWSGVPLPSPNLLEQLTKLRKALYLHLLAYRKGYNSRTTEWKRRLWQDVGERTGVSMPSLGVSPFQHIDVSSNLEALHYLGVFMEVLVSRHGGLNHWSVVI